MKYVRHTMEENVGNAPLMHVVDKVPFSDGGGSTAERGSRGKRSREICRTEPRTHDPLVRVTSFIHPRYYSYYRNNHCTIQICGRTLHASAKANTGLITLSRIKVNSGTFSICYIPLRTWNPSAFTSTGNRQPPSYHSLTPHPLIRSGIGSSGITNHSTTIQRPSIVYTTTRRTKNHFGDSVFTNASLSPVPLHNQTKITLLDISPTHP